MKRTNWQQPVSLSTQKVDQSLGVLGSPQSYLPSVSPRNSKLPLMLGSACCLGVVASLFVPTSAQAAVNNGEPFSPVLTNTEMFMGRTETSLPSDSATQFVVVPATTLAVVPNELSLGVSPDAAFTQGTESAKSTVVDPSLNPTQASTPVPVSVRVLPLPSLTAEPTQPSLDLLGISMLNGSPYGNGFLSASGLGHNLLASSDLLRRQSFTPVDQLLADPLAPAPILPYEPTLSPSAPVAPTAPAPTVVAPAAPPRIPAAMVTTATTAPFNPPVMPAPAASAPEVPTAVAPASVLPAAPLPAPTVSVPVASPPVVAPAAPITPVASVSPAVSLPDSDFPAMVPVATSTPVAPAPAPATFDPFASRRIAAAVPSTPVRATRNPLTQAIDLQIIAPIARRINIPRLPSLDLPPLPGADRLLPSDSQFGQPDPSITQQFAWPARGVFTSGYGPRWGRMHRGIDIAGPVGTPIFAAAEGVVVRSEWSSGGFGNLVTIQHQDGSRTLYAHNNRLLVSAGQQVRQGEQIAEMGSTGRSTGPHLHFEIHPAGRGAVNPMAFLSRSNFN